MLYNEFLIGTGCKDNEHNYEVYQNLEAMYMNTNMSKEQIYAYGRKLVDNSKSEDELALEKEIKEMIENEKEEVKYYEERADHYLRVMEDKAQSNRFKGIAKRHRQRIRELRSILA